jgi:hypothetical protein
MRKFDAGALAAGVGAPLWQRAQLCRNGAVCRDSRKRHNDSEKRRAQRIADEIENLRTILLVRAGRLRAALCPPRKCDASVPCVSVRVGRHRRTASGCDPTARPS